MYTSKNAAVSSSGKTTNNIIRAQSARVLTQASPIVYSSFGVTSINPRRIIKAPARTIAGTSKIPWGITKPSRNFQGDPALLDQAASYTETQIGVPDFITYTTTGVSRVSDTDMQVSFSIGVSSTAPEGICEFQVEYGLLDSDMNPLEPLTNNVFSFRIKVVP